MRPTPLSRAIAGPQIRRAGGWTLLTVLGVAIAGQAAEPAAESAVVAGWQALSISAYADAAREFAQAGPGRQAELGAAITLLNRPPVTPASLAEAQRRLRELLRTDDGVGHAAHYFLGRLLQLHPLAPDPAAAAQEYEALVATGADDPWCRLALVKLAILRLTVLPGPGDLAAQQAAVESALGLTRDPVTQRDLHLVIAEARMNREVYNAATLGHLEAALAATGSADILRPDIVVQAGRLASRLGDRAKARAHYASFLHDYPKDRRAFTVAAALEHVDGVFPP